MNRYTTRLRAIIIDTLKAYDSLSRPILRVIYRLTLEPASYTPRFSLFIFPSTVAPGAALCSQKENQMTRLHRILLSSLTFIVFYFCSSAYARADNLIINGDFESGNLAGWTTFTTVNGILDGGVDSFDTTGSGESLAASFQVGQAVYEGLALQRGGGIFQRFYSNAGLLSLRVDVASFNTCLCVNLDGGVYNMILDGVNVASFSIGDIPSLTPIRASLSASIMVGAGEHELRFLLTRGSALSGVSHHLDNITVSATAVPEPTTILLLGFGLSGVVAAVRRRKRP